MWSRRRVSSTWKFRKRLVSPTSLDRWHSFAITNACLLRRRHWFQFDVYSKQSLYDADGQPAFVLVTDGQLPLRQVLHPEALRKDIHLGPAFATFFDIRKEIRRLSNNNEDPGVCVALRDAIDGKPFAYGVRRTVTPNRACSGECLRSRSGEIYGRFGSAEREQGFGSGNHQDSVGRESERWVAQRAPVCVCVCLCVLTDCGRCVFANSNAIVRLHAATPRLTAATDRTTHLTSVIDH